LQFTFFVVVWASEAVWVSTDGVAEASAEDVAEGSADGVAEGVGVGVGDGLVALGVGVGVGGGDTTGTLDWTLETGAGEASPATGGLIAQLDSSANKQIPTTTRNLIRQPLHTQPAYDVSG
jgi:hypothetical protein